MTLTNPAFTRIHTEARFQNRLRWVLVLGTLAVAGGALTLTGCDDGQSPETPRTSGAAPRVTELLAASPAGATELLREFRWHSPAHAHRYRVIVRRGATVVWQAETAAVHVAPPPTGTIERDVQYEWLVEALDREGNVRMTSPPQPFVVY